MISITPQQAPALRSAPSLRGEEKVAAAADSFQPGEPAWGQSLTGDIRFHQVPSQVLGNSRQVWVYLPPSYGMQPDRRYPVVYAMDGQNQFEKGTAFGGTEWGLDEAADRAMRQGSMQEAIVVAVSNGGPERLNEYSPVPDPRHGGGGAPRFAAFMHDELMPLVNGAYRTETAREKTAVLGSSMGGLVSLYLGLAQANTFGLVGALSPSLWWAERDMLKEWQTAPASVAPPVRVWLDMGDAEDPEDADANGVPDVLDDTRRMAGVLHDRGAQVLYREIPGATHSEAAWASRIQSVLEGLLPPERGTARP